MNDPAVNHSTAMRNFFLEKKLDGGPDAIANWLISVDETQEDVDSYAQDGLRELDPIANLDDLEDLSRLVRVALECRHERVWLAAHWHFDDRPISRPGSEQLLAEVVRPYLTSSSGTQKYRAMEILGLAGWKWSEHVEDITQLLTLEGLNPEHAARVQYWGVRFGVQSRDAIQQWIDEQFQNGNQGEHLLHLASCYGEVRHFDSLIASAFQLEPGRRDTVLGLAMNLASRFPHELGAHCGELFLELDQRDLFFLNSYFQRFFDSPAQVRRYVEDFIAVVAKNGNTLFAQNLVTGLLRPSHLDALGHLSHEGIDLNVMYGMVVSDSEGKGPVMSIDEYARQGIVSVASRISEAGLPEVLVNALGIERSPVLLDHYATALACWGRVNNIVPAVDSFATSADMIWRLAPAFGACGDTDTIESLLALDPRHNGEAVPENYSVGLAYAVANANDARVLCKLLDDPTAENWLRESAAFAIRRAFSWSRDLKVEWSNIERFIGTNVESDFFKSELLVATAFCNPTLAASILSATSRPWSSPVTFAASFLNDHLDVVVEEVGKKSPGQNQIGGGFDEQYWAMTVGRLYSCGLLNQNRVIQLLGTDPFHDVHYHFARCVDNISEADHELRARLLEHLYASNRGGFSRPYLWQAIGHLLPESLWSVETMECLTEASCSAIKGYLDALVRQDMAVCNQAEIWKVVQSLLTDESRAVQWYAAAVAYQVFPDVASAAVTEGLLQPRNAVDIGIWADENVWDSASKQAELSQWLTLSSYARTLDEKREPLRWVKNEYWPKVIGSQDRYEVWRYVQALIEIPSEWTLWQIDKYDPVSTRDSFFVNWLRKEITNSLKKERQNLLKKGRLPGEDWSPSWF